MRRRRDGRRDQTVSMLRWCHVVDTGAAAASATAGICIVTSAAAVAAAAVAAVSAATHRRLVALSTARVDHVELSRFATADACKGKLARTTTTTRSAAARRRREKMQRLSSALACVHCRLRRQSSVLLLLHMLAAAAACQHGLEQLFVDNERGGEGQRERATLMLLLIRL